MKAIVSLILLTTIINLLVRSQNKNTNWEIQIGLSNRGEGTKDLIEFYDKGLYVQGLVENNGQMKGWNVKTGINGNQMWDKTLLHNSFLLQGWSVAIDNEGNSYITGQKFGGITWPFVSKFNPCGEEVWCKVLQFDAEFQNGYSTDIIISKDNEIIILTSLDSEEEIDKIHLIGLNENGDVLWKKPYASKNDHPWISEPVTYDIMELNHEYYISGYCYWPYPNDTNHVFLRPLFIGIDSLFNEKWILPFYALDSVFGDAYYSIPINDTMILGVGMRKFFNNNEDFSLLAVYNTSGHEIGYSEITNSQIGPEIHSNLIKKNIERINDTLYLAASMFGPDYGINPGGEFVLDTAGNLYNFQSRPNTSSASLIKSSDNNFVLASTITEPNNDNNIYLYKINKDLEFVPFDTNTYTYDSLCPGGIQSGTIDLSDCFVWTGTEEIPSPEEYYSFIATIPITAFPNPAEIEITLVFQNTDHHSNMLVECYNIYGQKVHTEKIWKGQQETRIDLQGWAKGLYFAVVKSEGKVAGSGRFVRR